MNLQILGFICFILFSFIICGIMLLGGWLLGQRTVSRSKHIPFESGIIACGNTELRLSIKFYLIAVFFLIFDIEAIYLYSWSVNIKRIGWIGFYEVSFFIFFLLLSLLYFVKERIFQWVPKKSINIH
ncbi:NADH-quinone oxidoreductase subunit A [Buchnera aphidicola]|uniref:NADH-quinone oxidoreductase subunit A n=1 Tax=Buchnera aphidicola TaxID=9 RepID=UPI003463CFB8